MNVKRQKRLIILLTMLFGVGITIGLVLFALKNNINLYYTPSQLNSKIVANHKLMRLGGLVEKNSLHRESQGLALQFVVTDYHAQVKVAYEGVLPALFREGQGVIAEGNFNSQGLFIAKQIFAKHDEKYMPPKVRNKL